MAISHIHKFTWPEGVTPMLHAEWIATLSAAEQAEFAEAKIRQRALRDEAVTQGNLQVVADGYIWKDKAAAEINKPHDADWLKYWDRYIKETQTIFTIEEIEC